MSQKGKEWRAQFSRGQCCRADCKPLYYTPPSKEAMRTQSSVTMLSVLLKSTSISAWQSPAARPRLKYLTTRNVLRYRSRYILLTIYEQTNHRAIQLL